MMGGAMLLAGFAMLARRRAAALITLYQAQAVLLAATAFWLAAARHDQDLYAAAAVMLIVNAALVPVALRRMAPRFDLARGAEGGAPVGLSMLLGVALVGIAMLGMPAVVKAGMPREALAIAVAIILLGLLTIGLRRQRLSQLIAFLSIGNGVALAAVEMPAMPFVAALPVALLVLSGCLALGMVVFRAPEVFERLDAGGS